MRNNEAVFSLWRGTPDAYSETSLFHIPALSPSVAPGIPCHNNPLHHRFQTMKPIYYKLTLLKPHEDPNKYFLYISWLTLVYHIDRNLTNTRWVGQVPWIMRNWDLWQIEKALNGPYNEDENKKGFVWLDLCISQWQCCGIYMGDQNSIKWFC